MCAHNLCILALAAQALVCTQAITITGNVTRYGMDDFDNDHHYGFLEITIADGQSYHVVVDADTEGLRTGDGVQLQLEPWKAGETQVMGVPDFIGVDQWWQASGPVSEVESHNREADASSARDGDRTILLIQVCLRSTCPSYTDDDQLRKAMVGVDSITRESSYKRTGFPAAKVSIFKSIVDHDIKSYKTCDSSRAINAARATLIEQRKSDPSLPDPSKFRHVSYFIPTEIPGCRFAGYAYVGGTVSVNRADSVYVMAHELGHNIGMWHAASDWNDDGKQDGEYGDTSSYMGGRLVAVNALQRNKMGWIPANQRVSLDPCSSAKVTLRDLEVLASSGAETNSTNTQSSGTVLATIPRGSAVGGGTYYVSYRAGQRRRMQNKVSIHYDKSRNTQAVAFMDASEVCQGSSCKSSSGWVGHHQSGPFKLTVEQVDQANAVLQIKALFCCGQPGCTTTTTTTAIPCAPLEASSYELVREVDVPGRTGNWDSDADVPYSVKKTVASHISRIAYCLQLGDQWVWTSFDHTDASKVGVPTDFVMDQSISNLNVYSNVVALPSQMQTQGKLEFWDHCYAPSNGKYDSDDDMEAHKPNCYGSMQIHSAGKTIWSFNGWSRSSNCDVQIGNAKNSHGNTDGTFNNNCQSYVNGKGKVRTYIQVSAASTTTTTTTVPLITKKELCKCVMQHNLCNATCKAMFGANISAECKQLYVKGLCRSNPIILPQQPYSEVCLDQCSTTTTTTTSSSAAPPSTTTAMPTTITTTVPASPIKSGEIIFLKTRSGSSKHIDSEGEAVQARWDSQGSFQALTIEKEGGGLIASGDIVFLRNHRDVYIDIQGAKVQSRWQDRGDWQAITIIKKSGERGTILADDLVCLQGHTGNYLDVEDDVVQARWTACGDWQTMMIQREVVGAIFSGHSLHLVSEHTHNLIHAEGEKIECRWTERGLWQTFSIENYGGRAIFSGDAVFLKSWTGVMLDVSGVDVRARWKDYGDWQKFVIEKAGNGEHPSTQAILPGDVIFLRAHTGKYLDVGVGINVQARWQERGLWQSLKVEKATTRRLTVLV